LFSRRTWWGETRTLKWKFDLPTSFIKRRLVVIRAASSALCRIWHASSTNQANFGREFLREVSHSN